MSDGGSCEIDHETELDMRTDGERLIIEPVRRARKARVKAAVERAMADPWRRMTAGKRPHLG